MFESAVHPMDTAFQPRMIETIRPLTEALSPQPYRQFTNRANRTDYSKIPDLRNLNAGTQFEPYIVLLSL